MEFKLKTLTRMWTGGIEKDDNNILHITGLKGSVRWWYEALIRGLGGYACDPTDDKKCTLTTNEKITQDILDSLICPACQLFGCTGWSGKVKLLITDNDGKIITAQLSKNENFIFKFVDLKSVTEMENDLLSIAMKIIVEYGAIGGKTVLKPSDHGCPKDHHHDYGLLSYQDSFHIISSPKQYNLTGKYKRLKKGDTSDYPNLKYFWFVKGKNINRVQHNEIVERDPRNKFKEYLSTAGEIQYWLGGGIGVSKKIFSFSSPSQCWGYVRDDNELKLISEKIKEKLGNSINIIEGKEVLSEFGLLPARDREVPKKN